MGYFCGRCLTWYCLYCAIFSPRINLGFAPMAQQRYKLTLAYRGTRYHGWQKQLAVETYKGEPPPEGEGIPTVQETLAKAMMTVLRHPILIVGSSRTDSG